MYILKKMFFILRTGTGAREVTEFLSVKIFKTYLDKQSNLTLKLDLTSKLVLL